MALDFVKSADDLLSRHDTLSPVLHSTAVQLKLTHANICLAAGDIDRSRSLYAGIVQMVDVTDEETADLVAIARLKFAEIILNERRTDGQRLVRESILHFEDQTTRRGQGQWARALFYKALLGSNDSEKQSKKRARRALEDVCEEFGLSQPPEGELSKKDFEVVLELGYR
ncbi:uncharacterized protein M421DRAFT_9979 [Didymella exigua CBS 183.55]|uniref:TPR-like protein n=1 Tax=Didymella exigua CBS 183.55 TaxID=1150837 RepID=A0A6A5R672_9PLEO|nr:uncharacterized protein M421DRAFT_9979 [Didymella exigua CBS 183.55]KAF1923073.1 hypothetical protein M421DRAFT_9979 [Didymella exigua CBS 183.55]